MESHKTFKVNQSVNREENVIFLSILHAYFSCREILLINEQVMQGGILTPPFAIITYAVLLNYQSLPRIQPGPAAAPAGDTSGPTPHSSARSGRSPWRPARSPRLLPHFLRNTLGAAGIQLRRVGALRVGVFTLGQQLLQLIEEQPLVAGFAEAACGAFVAGRSDRVYQHQQRIVVTVRRDAHYIEDMARGFTLGPQPLLGARVKVTLPVASVFSSASLFM